MSKKWLKLEGVEPLINIDTISHIEEDCTEIDYWKVYFISGRWLKIRSEVYREILEHTAWENDDARQG